MQQLIELYKQWKGAEPAHIHQLTGAGSNRSYYRLTDKEGQTVIGVIGTSRDENHAFLYLTEHFNRRKLPVPQILAASDDQLRYLQTDLGSVSVSCRTSSCAVPVNSTSPTAIPRQSLMWIACSSI